jgi:D-glycero-alpha-D-manno-heptose 1-phosphate guanylyltransferase
MTPEVILLAGGLGTRLRSVVHDVPKPLAPVAGRPFLEHLLDYWIGYGARRFILSVGYLCERIEAHFGDAYRSVPLVYATEREPLGTGGGLLLALAKVSGDGPLFAANGDTFFALDLGAMNAFHAVRRADFTLALFSSTDVQRYTSVELAADGRVASLKSSGTGAEPLANGGVYAIRPAVIARAGFRAGDRVSLEDELLPGLLKAGVGIFGYASDARFIDIGFPEDYARAASVIEGAR